MTHVKDSEMNYGKILLEKLEEDTKELENLVTNKQLSLWEKQ